MGSRRLPEKSLKPLGKATLVEHVVRRTDRAFPNPVLAIPESSENDVLADRAREWPCRVYRGAEEDVLQRFHGVLDQVPEAQIILRLTGDNPFVSPRLMKKGVQFLTRNPDFDWTTYGFLPRGIGTSAFRRKWIRRANKHARAKKYREHVTLWIKEESEARGAVLLPPPSYRAPGLRLTVDYSEDFDLVSSVVDAVGKDDYSHTVPEVINHLINHPKLIAVNRESTQELLPNFNHMLFFCNFGGKWGRGHLRRAELLQQRINQSGEAPTMIHNVLGNSGPVQYNPKPFDLIEEYDSSNFGFSRIALAELDHSLGTKDITEWARRCQPQLTILDIKRTSRELFNQLSAEVQLLVGMEDRGASRGRMDAVVDPNLYGDTLEDDAVAENQRYYGPDYAMIDPAYRKNRLGKVPNGAERVGLCFGGTDPAEIGPLFIKGIAPRFKEIKFHLMGTELEIETPKNVTLDGFVEDAPKRFASMDFMVISGGVLKFEMACLRMPSMILAQNQEQYENSRRFIEKNGLHWPVFPPGEDAAAWAETLFEATQSRALAASFRATEGVVDGKGLQRVLKILHHLIENKI